MSFENAMIMLKLQNGKTEDASEDKDVTTARIHNPPLTVEIHPATGRNMDDLIYKDEDERKYYYEEFDEHNYSDLESDYTVVLWYEVLTPPSSIFFFENREKSHKSEDSESFWKLS